MEFADDLLLASPYFERNDERFQVDLLCKRADCVITVCEIKHHNKKIGTHIIPEMERKCTLVKPPRGYADEKDGHISLYEIMYVYSNLSLIIYTLLQFIMNNLTFTPIYHI